MKKDNWRASVKLVDAQTKTTTLKGVQTKTTMSRGGPYMSISALQEFVSIWTIEVASVMLDIPVGSLRRFLSGYIRPGYPGLVVTGPVSRKLAKCVAGCRLTTTRVQV